MLGMVEARQATTPKPESQTHGLQLHVWSRKKQGGRNGAEHMHKKERGLGMYKQIQTGKGKAGHNSKARVTDLPVSKLRCLDVVQKKEGWRAWHRWL